MIVLVPHPSGGFFSTVPQSADANVSAVADCPGFMGLHWNPTGTVGPPNEETCRSAPSSVPTFSMDDQDGGKPAFGGTYPALQELEKMAAWKPSTP